MTSNVFNDGLTALKEVLKNNVEVSVTYIHNGTSYQIKATRGSINWSTLNKVGDIALAENYRDYIVRAEQIGFTPSDRDKIIDGSETYEVFRDNQSSQCWRYSDPFKTLIRIYTRKI